MDLRRKFQSHETYEERSRILPVFLSFIPGFFAMGLLVAAVTIASWLEKNIVPTSASFQVTSIGLFYVCKTQVNNIGTGRVTSEVVCNTREEEAASGFAIDPLEQATRSLLIISVILHIPGIITAVFFGLRRNERKRGPFIPGGVFLVAAVCAISGMACYSAFLASQIAQSQTNLTYTRTVPGISFMTGWFATVCSIISTLMAFVSYTIY